MKNNSCIICGYPKKQWPRIYTNRDNVKNIFLCEWHMECATSCCVSGEYSQDQIIKSQISMAIIEKANEMFESLYTINEINNVNDDIDEFFTDKIEKASSDWFDNFPVLSCYKEDVVNIYFNRTRHRHANVFIPSSVYIDESRLDDWLCKQITRFARAKEKGNPIYRCAGITKLNGVHCKKKVIEPFTMCKQCEERGSSYHPKIGKKENIVDGLNRMEMALSVLKGE